MADYEQMLVSFLLSALLLGAVILWGYWMESLPSGLLTPADHYVLHMLKNGSLRFKDPNIVSHVSDDQIRRRRTVAGYVKVLGDQQLITGLAIVIAALALRQKISLYKFSIVTSLAYFAAFTHLCSLYILREYMHHHKSARAWHLAFTIGFLGLLCLAFVIDGAIDEYESSLDFGNALQCFFEPTEDIAVNTLNYFVIVGGLFTHIRVLGDLFFLRSSSLTSRLLYRLMSLRLRKSRLSPNEREAVLHDAERKYWAWLRPSSVSKLRQAIPLWYIIETYHDSELSFIPTMLAFFAYGTSRVFFAVKPAGSASPAGLKDFGFGQVVAIGPIALTLLTMIEIHNGNYASGQNSFSALILSCIFRRNIEGCSHFKIDICSIEP